MVSAVAVTGLAFLAGLVDDVPQAAGRGLDVVGHEDVGDHGYPVGAGGDHRGRIERGSPRRCRSRESPAGVRGAPISRARPAGPMGGPSLSLLPVAKTGPMPGIVDEARVGRPCLRRDDGPWCR